jgi:D-arabinose 1-dehydrogenase-like Zn-dependent alcohol dehydrogenase
MKLRAVQVPAPGKPFELVEREIPEPGPRQVVIRVEACGICHSDSFPAEGHWPGITYPRVPGHEIAGHIHSVGGHVGTWQPGQRVGVGWFGGACYQCEPCRRGDHVSCRNLKVPGITYDGGYADYMACPVDALASIPDDLSAVEAAPLLCAGITTFNSIRHSGALPGDTVAILGIGGLGHLGVQFAAKMGFRTVAIARGKDKEALAKQLGAHHYIDSTAGNPGEALAALGGAKTILSTVTSGSAISAVVGGLAVRGKLVIVGVSMEPIEVGTIDLVSRSAGLLGHASGTSIESEDTMRFSALTGVRPMIETVPLERAAEAYAKMMSGEARFRMVLTMT